MAELPNPTEGILLTHFVVSQDVERSRRFYTEVLGGEIVLEGEPTIVALANSWIIINVGGGPRDDKPTVTLEAPPDPDRVSAFLNIPRPVKTSSRISLAKREPGSRLRNASGSSHASACESWRRRSRIARIGGAGSGDPK